jgi:hypothetical protein
MRRKRRKEENEARRAQRLKALAAWNEREITSSELLRSMAVMLKAAMRCAIWKSEGVRGHARIIEQLDRLRLGRKILTVDRLIHEVRCVLDPAREQEIAAKKTAQKKLLEQLHTESLEQVDAGPLQLREYQRPLTEPPDDVRSAIGRELRSLAFFAQLPADLPQPVLPYARVIALRVFGGWSLERIAEHDSQSVEDVTALWQEARSWLARRDQFASETGSLIETSPISGAVLRALQASPRLLHVLEWRAFERIIAQILESLGYEVELQRGTKDGGIDVIAVKQATEFGPHRYLLQAKRSRYKIGVEPVRELLFLKNEYRATKACMATTSSFTSGAWKLANEHRWELELRDFDRLREWLDTFRSAR